MFSVQGFKIIFKQKINQYFMSLNTRLEIKASFQGFDL